MPRHVSESDLSSLLPRIYDLRNRTYQLIGYGEASQPGPPATEEQIREVESTFRCDLPDVYRTFLLIHNGWKHWSGDVALLSTEQMLQGQYVQRIAEWKKKELTRGNRLVSNSLVIGFSLFVGEQILIDFSSPTREEIVFFDQGEEERFPDFYAYLLNFEAILEEELT